jgi:hypothetical protein
MGHGEWNSLIVAAKTNHGKIAKMLLAAGADVNLPSSDERYSALMAAAEEENETIVQLLLESGADPNFRTKKLGVPPLTIASRTGNLRIVRLLLSAGADPNLRDKSDRTALVPAVFEGNEEAMDELLAAGADVNVGIELGRTPLLLSILNGNDDITKRLLAAGARIAAPEFEESMCALMLAKSCGQTKIVEILEDSIRERQVLLLSSQEDKHRNDNPEENDPSRIFSYLSECYVCHEDNSTHGFYPCGHVCLCADDAKSRRSKKRGICPACHCEGHLMRMITKGN